MISPGEKLPTETPTYQALSREKIQHVVLMEAATSLWTTMPFALGMAGVLFFGVSSNPMALAMGCAGIVMGPAIGFCNWWYRGATIAEQYQKKILEQRQASQNLQLEKLLESCRMHQFTEGIKEASEVHAAFKKLQEFLQDKAREGTLEARQWAALAEDVCQQGLNYVRLAMELHGSLSAIDIQKLQSELEDYTQEKKQVTGRDAERLNRRIESHQKRIQRYHEKQHQIADLLAEADSNEGSLEAALLDLIDRFGEGSELRFDLNTRAANMLETRLRALKRVDQNILGGRDTSYDDELLAEAEKLT
jgi:hypothetical protein